LIIVSDGLVLGVIEPITPKGAVLKVKPLSPVNAVGSISSTPGFS